MKKFIKKVNMTIVNLITLTRFFGSILLPFIYYKKGISIAAVVIICLFLTDAIDGFLARKLKISTFFGSILDAISDKLLNAIAFIILGIEYNIMFCPLVIELAIFYTFYSTYRYGGNIQSSRIGKNKTIILDICVVLCFLLLSLPTFNIYITYTDFYINILGILTIVSCIFALYDYMLKNKKARENPDCIKIKKQQRYRKKKSFGMILDQLFDTEYYQEHKDESILKLLYL